MCGKTECETFSESAKILIPSLYPSLPAIPRCSAGGAISQMGLAEKVSSYIWLDSDTRQTYTMTPVGINIEITKTMWVISLFLYSFFYWKVSLLFVYYKLLQTSVVMYFMYSPPHPQLSNLQLTFFLSEQVFFRYLSVWRGLVI